MRTQGGAPRDCHRGRNWGREPARKSLLLSVLSPGTAFTWFLVTVAGKGQLLIQGQETPLSLLRGLGVAGRLVTTTEEEWCRAGRILARYQNRYGHVEPGDHIGDILILLAAERLGTDLVTENGEHFRLWSRFRPVSRRPRLIVLERRNYEI